MCICIYIYDKISYALLLYITTLRQPCLSLFLINYNNILLSKAIDTNNFNCVLQVRIALKID